MISLVAQLWSVAGGDGGGVGAPLGETNVCGFYVDG